MSRSADDHPDIAQALQQALRLHQAGRLDEAAAHYRLILASSPDNPDALHLLGLVLRRQGDASQAVALISRAVELRPGSHAYRNNLGLALLDSGLHDQAAASFRAALDIQPQFAEALVNLGNCLRAAGRYEEAAEAYRRALALRLDLAEAHNNLGNVLRDQGNETGAATCYAAALQRRPDYAEANNNLGALLNSQDRHDEAMPYLRKALAADPRNADALCNLAAALRDQGQPDDALASYRAALALRPDDAATRWSQAMAQIPLVYRDAAQVDAARAAFDTALADLDAWVDDDRIETAAAAVGTDQPYYLAYQPHDNRALLARYGSLCHRIMRRWQAGRPIAAEPIAHKQDGARLRVGIVSAQIREHSVWRTLTRGWVQHLDRSRFEICVVHLGTQSDEETAFAALRADAFLAGSRTLAQWAGAIAQLQADALIYPEIGMDPLTVKLANLRLAPLQLAAWGHPETTGLPTIDAYLSAADFEPPDAQRLYTERLVALPHLGCSYAPPAVDAQAPDLAALGLDDGRALLLCPGTPYKYLPQQDRVWVAIARALPACRLVFFRHRKRALSDLLQERLRIAFAAAGLDSRDHVAFIPWQRRATYYGLMQRARLCLDSIGFSGFNTAMQAIECGLPLVTVEGRHMRGRFASAILRRLGLDELVASDDDAYIARAIALANDAPRCTALSERIVATRDTLFDDLVPVRALETFLDEACRR
jgi:protein O-GlcNAc transferase